MFDACVYWIHHPNMQDYYTEGYIGVSTDFLRRQTVHLSLLRAGKHENIHLQRAYNIDSNVIVDLIYVGEELSCYELEESLRPHRNRGWNINVGGVKPPTYHGQPRPKRHGGVCFIKPVTAPDGRVFQSLKAAALHYDVTEDTIRNWLKDSTKPWTKRASIHQHKKFKVGQHVAERQSRPIQTPAGTFKSVKAAAQAYNVVHGTVNYWLKTKSTEFYYLN